MNENHPPASHRGREPNRDQARMVDSVIRTWRIIRIVTWVTMSVMECLRE